MKKFITDKGFYATVLAITLPIALQNLIVFGVSMMDTIMLGRLGDIQLSACSQANQPGFVFQMFNFGLAGGGTVLASQYWGKRDMNSIKKIFSIVIRATIIASIILTLFALIFPEEIMKFYIKTETAEDRLILSEAVDYLRIVACSYLFFGLSVCTTFMLRSIEVIKISVITSSISFVVNVFFNWVFIFGNLGANALGIKGAAIGTLIARATECLLVLGYLLFIDKRLKIKISDIFRHDTIMLKDYLKYSLPVVGNELMWAGGMSLQAAILGKLSSQILAANSIANVLQQLSTLITLGTGSAACVLVGKKIGEGKIKEARSMGSTFMIWSLILGAIATTIIILLRKPFVSIYNVSPSTKELAQNLLIITAIVVFFASISVNSIVGVLRGAGDTKFTFRLEMTTLWIIAIPFGAIAGFIFKLPILLTYACLKIDEPIKAVIAYYRTTKKSTYKSVTRDNL